MNPNAVHRFEVQHHSPTMRTTSREAFDFILATGILPKQRAMVYKAVFAFGPITGRELNRDLAGPSYHKRLSELERLGVIREDGVKKCGVTGRNAVAWIIEDSPPQMREKEGAVGKSGLETMFAWACAQTGLAEPEHEATFHPTRKWRVDFLWREQRVAVEIEGGIFAKGRHTRGVGYAKDADKYNQLTMMGFKLLRFTTVQMKHPLACAEMVKELLQKSP